MTELKIDELVFITIDKLRPVTTPLFANHDNKKHPIPATHELVSHSTRGANIRYSCQGIEVPGADIGVLIYLRGGKLLSRGPSTRVLIYGEHLYFLLTWNDASRLDPAFPGARAMSDVAWQPIETAPRDGTDFLAFCCFQRRRHHQMVGCFAPSGNFASWPGRWNYEPTHWMPLPEPRGRTNQWAPIYLTQHGDTDDHRREAGT